MRDRPVVLRGYRTVSAPLYPERLYVYRGDQPLVTKRKKTREDAPPCEEPGCDRQSHAVGLCPSHYYRYKDARRKDPSLPRREPRRHAAFNPDACGTPRGHQRHKYWGQEPCQPCKTARTKYRRERRAIAEAKAKEKAA